MNWAIPFRWRITVQGLRALSSIHQWLRQERPPKDTQVNRSKSAADPIPKASFEITLSGVAYIEILVIGGLIPAALLWFAQEQSLQIVLPWLVLSPLLLGLHYGFLAGTAGALSTAVVLAGISYLKPDLLSEFPKAPAIGLLLVGMVSGEARDIWDTRTQRLEYLCHYHQTRLKQFTNDYQLLHVSHSQLERQVAGSGKSLRTALKQLKLRESVLDPARNEPLRGIGDWVLEILADASELHTAAVYEINGQGILRLPSVAMLGKPTDMSPFNPLLRETLHSGLVTCVHASNEAGHEHVIAVIPLIDASGHVHGVVSINDMPFLSIHQDTFELLGVLGRYIGDILARRTRSMSDTRGTFTLRESLQRNLFDAKKHAVPAALIACRIVDAACRDLLVAHCYQSSRGMDHVWISINAKGETVILTLLPFTDEAGVRSYMARLEGKQAGGITAMRRIVADLWMLDQHRTADEILADVCQRCDIEVLDPRPTKQFHVPLEAVP